MSLKHNNQTSDDHSVDKRQISENHLKTLLLHTIKDNYITEAEKSGKSQALLPRLFVKIS